MTLQSHLSHGSCSSGLKGLSRSPVFVPCQEHAAKALSQAAGLEGQQCQAHGQVSPSRGDTEDTESSTTRRLLASSSEDGDAPPASTSSKPAGPPPAVPVSDPSFPRVRPPPRGSVGCGSTVRASGVPPARRPTAPAGPPPPTAAGILAHSPGMGSALAGTTTMGGDPAAVPTGLLPPGPVFVPPAAPGHFSTPAAHFAAVTAGTIPSTMAAAGHRPPMSSPTSTVPKAAPPAAKGMPARPRAAGPTGTAPVGPWPGLVITITIQPAPPDLADIPGSTDPACTLLLNYRLFRSGGGKLVLPTRACAATRSVLCRMKLSVTALCLPRPNTWCCPFRLSQAPA